MAPQRPAKTPSAKVGGVLERGYRSFDQYRELYPNLAERVSTILQSEIPFVRERVDAMRARVERQSGAREGWFARKFNLTPMEARVAVFLAEGGSVAAFAKAHRKSPATVRSHLKAIFRKTGASRQAELPSLLHKRTGLL